MKHRKTTLTEGNPVKLIVLFAIPIFLGNLFQILYSLIDTKIVGSTLGETALASVGSVSTLYNQFDRIPLCQSCLSVFHGFLSPFG